MNTKSMILTLNIFILFHTVSHGFSISSLRKKVGETCASIGKKSLAIIAIMVVSILFTLSMRGGAFALAMLRSPWRGYNRPLVTPAWPIHHDPEPVSHHQEHKIRRRPAIPLYEFFRAASMSYPRGSWESSLTHQAPAQQEASSDSSDYEEEIETNPTQPLHHLPEELRGTLLDRIPYLKKNEKTGKYELTSFVDAGGKKHTHQDIPENIAQLITQFVCHGEFYHDKDLRVPDHYSDPHLLIGRHDDQHAHPEKRITISFIDGNPDELQLALLPRLYRNVMGPSPSTRYIDAIHIDTRAYRQHTRKNIKNVLYMPHYPATPTNYLQKVASLKKVLLIKQLTFTSHGSSAYDSSERTGETTNFNDGIQRDLKDGRGIWFVPYDRDFGNDCNTYVGIYEKGDLDDEFQIKWSQYFDPVKTDNTGETYLLHQVVKLPAPVHSISVPHSPVKLQKSSGEIVSGKEYYGRIPEGVSTILSDELPDDISIFAVGQKSSHTNTYCAIYKRRENNLKTYSPYLLMHQQDPMAQQGETVMLYQDAWSTPMQWARYGYYRTGASQLKDSVKLGAIAAGAWLAYKSIPRASSSSPSS
jgi:hypothetical protein